MKRSTLGRGLASLIHEVPPPDTPISPGLSTPLPWPVEHPSALTPSPLRLDVRSRLEKLSTRSRLGLKAARAYLDRLRQQDGRTHVSLDLSGVDLTSSTMLQLRHGRVTTSKRYQFLGVSIWLK
jgi:hypothetical protein